MNESIVQLAIETSSRHGSVALLQGEGVLQRISLDRSLRTAATLAPALVELMGWLESQGLDLGCISVADGPGSFTGLRVGVTTAKTLAYARGIPLYGVDSLAAIAAAVMDDSPKPPARILVALNAFRGQVFVGEFGREEILPSISEIPADWSAHPDSTEVLSAADFQQRLSTRVDGLAIAGDEKLFGEFVNKLSQHQCDAVGVGRLGFRASLQGHAVDPIAMVPRYMKVSAAEENAK